MPSQTEATPLPSAPNVREIGPWPLRTARGAGREAGRRLDALDLLRPFAGLGRLLVLRDRVLEPLLPVPPREVLERDVLVLRDPGGEDVRVAMVRPYGQVTPATGITGVRVVGPGSELRPTRPIRDIRPMSWGPMPCPLTDDVP